MKPTSFEVYLKIVICCGLLMTKTI